MRNSMLSGTSMNERIPSLVSVVVPCHGAELEAISLTFQSIPKGAETIIVCDPDQAAPLRRQTRWTGRIENAAGEWPEQFKCGLALGRGVFACWLRPGARFICPSWTWLRWLADTKVDVVYARAAVVDSSHRVLWYRGPGEFDTARPLVWFSQRIPGQPIFARRERFLAISRDLGAQETLEWEAQCTYLLLGGAHHRPAPEAVTAHPAVAEIDLVENPLWISAVTRLAGSPEVTVEEAWLMLRRLSTDHPARSNSGAKSAVGEGRLIAALVLARLAELASEHARIALFGAGKHTEWLVTLMQHAAALGRKLPQVSCILDDRAPTIKAKFKCPLKTPWEFDQRDGTAIVLSTDVWQREYKATLAQSLKHKCKVVDLYEDLGAGPFVKSQLGAGPVPSELWAQRMAQFKDKHVGERCFILGNGPSLNHTDLSLLAGEKTFGSNRIYLITPRTGFTPTYYVCTNKYLLQDRATEILRLPYPKFIRFYPDQPMVNGTDLYYYQVVEDHEVRFSKEPWRTMNEGGTVTFVCLQLAYFMGFREVYLVGVDHSFPHCGTPNKLVVGEADDANHFDARYFGKGCPWQYPDLLKSEYSYRIAREAFQADGRCVYDATIGGRLDIFPKKRYEYLFS